MTYYRDDDEYDREQAYRDQVRQVYAEAVKMEQCPFCVCGKVPVYDGSIAPGLAVCGQCAGNGYIVVQR